MPFFQNLEQMLQADLGALLHAAPDRLSLARELLREFEAALAATRTRLSGQESRETVATRTREALQADVALWRQREEDARQAQNTTDHKRAVRHRASLEDKLRAAEEKWWLASRQTAELRVRLDRLSNQAQRVRQLKDSVISMERRDRPSSEFSALPETAIHLPPASAALVDQELLKLRNELGK